MTEPSEAPAAHPATPPPGLTAFAPGRVNLIGEHTDYNGGLALPFAIDRGARVRATATAGTEIHVAALDLGETDEFPARNPSPAEGWRAFARGVAAELGRAGIPVPGAVVEVTGNVPRGGGLSSSAALSVSLALALRGLARTDAADRMELARLCSRVENEWVGAQTGLLDQLASLFGDEGQAVLIDFAALTLRPVPFALGEHRVVTLDSGETHATSGEGYGTRRRECAEACALLGIEQLSAADPEAVQSLPEPLRSRARHVLGENVRVREAVEAITDGDAARLGRILDASHASLRDLYAISTPAVERTRQSLLDAGALGARIVGGGFGGNVLGLLPAGAAPPVGAVEVRPGPGARIVDSISGPSGPGV